MHFDSRERVRVRAQNHRNAFVIISLHRATAAAAANTIFLPSAAQKLYVTWRSALHQSTRMSGWGRGGGAQSKVHMVYVCVSGKSRSPSPKTYTLFIASRVPAPRVWLLRALIQGPCAMCKSVTAPQKTAAFTFRCERRLGCILFNLLHTTFRIAGTSFNNSMHTRTRCNHRTADRPARPRN